VVTPGKGLKPWWDLCKVVREGYDGLERCSAEPAGKNKDDMESVAGYLCKYITKDKQPEYRKKLITYGRKWSRNTTPKVMLCTYAAGAYRQAIASYAIWLKKLWPDITEENIWKTILVMLKECRRTGMSVGDMSASFVGGMLKTFDHDLLPGMVEEYRKVFEDYKTVYASPYVMPKRMIFEENGKWVQLLNHNGLPIGDTPYS
jgi:hypothetical protein